MSKGILGAIPNRDIPSNDKTGDYQKYTGGLTHQKMVDDWGEKEEERSAGTIDGVQHVRGLVRGAAWLLILPGRFDLVTYLPTITKGHAWVKSAMGKRPEPGDILLHTGTHIDVAIEFKGDVFVRMAAGQGGPRYGYDILKRVTGTGDFNFANLVGWIDIDLYFKAAAMRDPVPPWLLGWWSVYDGNQYYYYFSAQNIVTYTKVQP